MKDIPVSGCFSTERESLKKTQLVAVADCEIVMPQTEVTPPAMNLKYAYGYDQYLIDSEKSNLNTKLTNLSHTMHIEKVHYA